MTWAGCGSSRQVAATPKKNNHIVFMLQAIQVKLDENNEVAANLISNVLSAGGVRAQQSQYLPFAHHQRLQGDDVLQ